MTPLHMPTILSVLTLVMSALLVGDLRASNLLSGPVYAQETQPDVTERGGVLPSLGVGPDLVPFIVVPPVTAPGGTSKQCPREGMVLHFMVKNQGNAPAPPSFAVVLFGPTDPPVGARIKALAANESIPVDIVIPRGCFGPNCPWAFHVDVAYEVPERVEKNNVISGLCGG